MATQEGAEQYGGQYATDLVPFQMLAAELEAKREKRGDLR
jgi:hypothetical protein